MLVSVYEPVVSEDDDEYKTYRNWKNVVLIVNDIEPMRFRHMAIKLDEF